MSCLSKNFLLGKVKKLSKHFIYQASEIIVNLYYALNRRTFRRVCFTVRTGSQSPALLWIWNNFRGLDWKDLEDLRYGSE